MSSIVPTGGGAWMKRWCVMAKTTVRTCQMSRTASGRQRAFATTSAMAAPAASQTPFCVTARPTALTPQMRKTAVIEEEEIGYFFLVSSQKSLPGQPEVEADKFGWPAFPLCSPSSPCHGLTTFIPRSPRVEVLPCWAALPLCYWPVFVGKSPLWRQPGLPRPFRWVGLLQASALSHAATLSEQPRVLGKRVDLWWRERLQGRLGWEGSLEVQNGGTLA